MEDLVELSCARIDSVLGRIQQLQQQGRTEPAAKGPSYGLAEEVLELMTENATLRKTVNDYVWMVAKPVFEREAQLSNTYKTSREYCPATKTFQLHFWQAC